MDSFGERKSTEGVEVPQRIVRVWVDETLCSSHEACKVVQEVFADGPSFLPMIPPEAPQHFDRLRTEVIEAVMSCPTAALLLEYEDGRVVSSRDCQCEAGLHEWLDR